jgi:hypothetical protein
LQKIFAAAVACAMAGPQSSSSETSVRNYSDGIMKRSSTSTLGNQIGQNPVVRKRRVNVLDANGKLVDFGKLFFLFRSERFTHSIFLNFRR